MSMTSTRGYPMTVERSDLERQDFTAEQIERLERLRAVYPYLEFVDSQQQWQRLVFLKWLWTARDV